MKMKMKIKKRGNAGVTLLICLLFVLVIALAVWMVLDKTNIIQNSTYNGTNNGSEINSNEINQNGENTNTTNTKLKTIDDKICVATKGWGKIYIEKNSNNVYYDPENVISLNIVSTDTIHKATYNPDPDNTIADLTFTGYKLDLTNVQAAYSIDGGNYPQSFFFVHKNGTISVMTFEIVNVGECNVTLTKNIPDISNIVSVMSTWRRVTMLIDSNHEQHGYLNNAASSTNDSDYYKTVSAMGKIIGDIYIDKTGNNIYYDPTGRDTIFSDLNIVSTDAIHSTTSNVSAAYPGQAESFEGYKLDLTNVESLYGVYNGNGGTDYSIIFVHKDGTISEMNFKSSTSSDRIYVTLTKNIQGISNIVSVVQNCSFSGYSTVLIDKDGNWYSYNGINYYNQ